MRAVGCGLKAEGGSAVLADLRLRSVQLRGKRAVLQVQIHVRPSTLSPQPSASRQGGAP
jgi:hypothetical protein